MRPKMLTSCTTVILVGVFLSSGAVVAVAVAAGMIYYPVATFLFPQFQFRDKSLDLKYDTTFIILKSQMNLVLGGVLVFFPSVTTCASGACGGSGFVLSVCAGLCAVLWLYCERVGPCLVKRVNLWQGAVYLAAGWTAGVVLFVTIGAAAGGEGAVGTTDALGLLLLPCGWGGILAITLLRHRRRYGTYGRFVRRLREATKAALASGLKKARHLEDKAKHANLAEVKRDLKGLVTDAAVHRRPSHVLAKARGFARAQAAFVRDELKQGAAIADELLLGNKQQPHAEAAKAADERPRSTEEEDGSKPLEARSAATGDDGTKKDR